MAKKVIAYCKECKKDREFISYCLTKVICSEGHVYAQSLQSIAAK